MSYKKRAKAAAAGLNYTGSPQDLEGTDVLDENRTSKVDSAQTVEIDSVIQYPLTVAEAAERSGKILAKSFAEALREQKHGAPQKEPVLPFRPASSIRYPLTVAEAAERSGEILAKSFAQALREQKQSGFLIKSEP